MCGIVGLICNKELHVSNFREMIGELEHRGPDSLGSAYLDIGNYQISLGHTRLSILDLSDNANQPKYSPSGRYIVVYNGEIYNHLMLREKYQFVVNGHSDTDTLLALFDEIGIISSLEVISGMFSFGVFDKHTNQLYLARDRFGEKPLYYHLSDNTLIFASELKAIIKSDLLDLSLNRSALNEFLLKGFINEGCIFDDIFKVKPGEVCCFKLNENSISVNAQRFYENKLAASNTKRNSLSFGETRKQLIKLLYDSVESQLISDVPLGVFLSGGVDSSLIAAIVGDLRAEKVDAFTVGFNQNEFDESRIAAKIAGHLGVDHNIFTMGSSDFKRILHQIPYYFDEPLGDSSQLPTFFVCEMASLKVRVVLSGDGADELFGGYNYYKNIPSLFSYTSNLNSRFRQSVFSSFERFLSFLQNKNSFFSEDFSKISKLMLILNNNSLPEMMESIYSIEAKEYFAHFEKSKGLNFEEKETLDSMMYYDFINYMPNDVLVKVDRASMANSIEVRAPFLSKDLVEFSSVIPTEYKVNYGQSKFILKDILSDYIPKDLIYRKKMGFSIPINELVSSVFIEEVEYYLSEASVLRCNLIEYSIVKRILRDHNTGNRKNGTLIYRLLVLHMWFEHWNKFTKIRTGSKLFCSGIV